MCAFLGITETDLANPAPYSRVLALNDKGRLLLKAARQSGCFPNAGEPVAHPYQDLEYRAGRLYSTFALNDTEPPYCEENRRVFYAK